MNILFHLTGELAFMGGLLLQYYSLLTPLPWQGGVEDSSLYFVPYVELRNPCAPTQPSNGTVPSVKVRDARQIMYVGDLTKREGNCSRPGVSNVAVWLGAFGSCSRDEDDRTFCTRPSLSSPQYNFTHIQSNSVYWPARMSTIIPRRKMLAYIILNSLGFLLFLLGSIPFWFPGPWRRISKIRHNESAAKLPNRVCCGLVASAIAQFVLNFSIRASNVGSYNSVINFYLPPSGPVRQLKPGLLLKAVQGNAYDYIWISWGLMNLYANLHITYRACVVDSRFKEMADEYDNSRSKRKEAKARAKEDKKLEKKVDHVTEEVSWATEEGVRDTFHLETIHESDEADNQEMQGTEEKKLSRGITDVA